MKKKITIALSGNPNSGKTTVFNAITGARQHIANYPGVTVEKKYGTVFHKGVEIEVVDLPGTYSLTAYSLEELVARDFLLNEKPDLVVDIVDASNLDRNLYLAIQFKEMGVPLIIALNMIDVAESRGIQVDAKKLSSLLDVPVVPMVARSKKGIEQLLDTIIESATERQDWFPEAISYGMDIDQSLKKITQILEAAGTFSKKYPVRWLALKCLEGDKQVLDLLKKHPDEFAKVTRICKETSKHVMNTLEEDVEGIIADHRYGYIAGITKKAVKRKIETRLNISDQIDKVLTNRLLGPIVMVLILYLVYAFTFWASEAPVGWFEAFFDGLKDIITSIVPPGNLQSLLVSGIIDGVGGVLGFIPLIMLMFFTIAILEDSGYMARIAYMLDRLLRWFGLHGNSVIALIVSGGISGGCAVPGVLATRTLRDPKERITTLLVVPFMNCGAKLPVLAMLIGAFFAKNRARMLFLLTLLSWCFALLAAKLIRSTVLRGPKTPFVMELPPYRLPTLQGLIIHSWERTWHYIKKAGTIILGISVVIWAMMTFPGLSHEQARTFDIQHERLQQAFLAAPGIGKWTRNKQDLEKLDHLYLKYVAAKQKNDTKALEHMEKEPLLKLAKAAYEWKVSPFAAQAMDPKLLSAARRYLDFREEAVNLEIKRHQTALKSTIAGWIGTRLEKVTRPLGFDFRVNIALIGGFAAKEVILSTLGTAYSLGEAPEEKGGSLAQRLRENPLWNPLQAFTLIIFTMLYVPCLATVISIRKETSWRWATFSILFNLAAAYFISLLIRQAGIVLGLGI
ncbi:MAG: ferrous iron transport protein B [Deltaproteobacteria bacterium]|nr:ferrous iron transport protein B [Deltaproteobacteria bacterium]MBW1927710.1 ferrous iron transport protein B [Deltaproteobacteria bacterium]MBW2025107.1 ferrous iron transport protein B [Deltaproteobacteria bacterium]MBW2125839.1 ferrous iron transport protein B [Deltaproteobacteria bacterium]RLB21581.1 MAG: ferrous iron transport protein B [Deltaproteobacteria bacterium]